MTRPIVIAHRGACGYLPEHSLEAKAMAHAMGADFIEQDVVLTADGVPVVLHDVQLDCTTDVASRYPDRAREDGRYYALDFTLAEIRELRAHERCDKDAAGSGRQVYPGRFPATAGSFRVPTLAEEIALLAGLDRSRRRRTGLYLEFKGPNWHQRQGYDLVAAVMAVLAETGYHQRPEQVFLQCFDDQTLQRLRGEFATPLPLVQLVAEPEWGEDSAVDYRHLLTRDGLGYVASYADGIGPWIPQVLDDGLAPTALVANAHAAGLLVHPYTLRADDLSRGAKDFDALQRALFLEAGVDGAFTDFTDQTCDFLKRHGLRP